MPPQENVQLKLSLAGLGLDLGFQGFLAICNESAKLSKWSGNDNFFLAQDTAFEDMLRYSRNEALQTYVLKRIDILS